MIYQIESKALSGVFMDIQNNSTNIPEFGIKRENEERRDGGCGVVFDPESQKYAIGVNAKNGAFWLFSGGVDSKENIKDGNKIPLPIKSVQTMAAHYPG